MSGAEFIANSIARDPNISGALRGLMCQKHQPKHAARMGAAHPQLENVCATCGSRIVRASAVEQWRAR